MFAVRLPLILMVMVFVTSGSAITSDKKMTASFFDEADTNNDGHLTKEEVKEAQLKRMKGPAAKDLLKKMNATEEQKKKIEHAAVNGFIAKTDLDKDGKITKKEFEKWIKDLEKILKAFQSLANPFKKKDSKKADKDGDGHMTNEELKKLYKDDLKALIAKDSTVKMLDKKVSQYHATQTKPFSVSQLIYVLFQMQGQVVEVMLEEGFMKADKNKDGKISKAEVDQLGKLDQGGKLLLF